MDGVERGENATLVQHPLNHQIQFKVRPDPDWTQRIGEAWAGALVNSRRESAGIIAVMEGRLVIADPNNSEGAITAEVVAGEYEVVLTVAHLGSEATYDYEEYVSHAFALRRDNEGVTTIEPLTDEHGTELGVEGTITTFAGEGVIARIAADYPDLRIWTIPRLLSAVSPEANLPDSKSVRAPTKDGSSVLIAVEAGSGRQDYPLFRLADAKGNTVGVLVDFFVDNRPYDE
uniref:hypothetical protein n=1 Tax=Edaphosphingomonas laterariae TaxID=861865 RepID=UPI0011819FE2|nr:hypothetical protein [Sphingomonas laterariae]